MKYNIHSLLSKSVLYVKKTAKIQSSSSKNSFHLPYAFPNFLVYFLVLYTYEYSSLIFAVLHLFQSFPVSISYSLCCIYIIYISFFYFIIWYINLLISFLNLQLRGYRRKLQFRYFNSFRISPFGPLPSVFSFLSLTQLSS